MPGVTQLVADLGCGFPAQALQFIPMDQGLGRCSNPAGLTGLLLALSDYVKVGIVSPPDPSLHADRRSTGLGLFSARDKMDTASPPSLKGKGRKDCHPETRGLRYSLAV